MSVLVNRGKDTSEQLRKISLSSTTVNNGSTLFFGQIMERACTIQQGQATGIGVSGSPALVLGVLRFANATSFTIGTSMLITEYGTSGYAAYSLPVAGSSLLQLQKGDVLNIQQVGGVGAATKVTIVELVVQDLQDVRTWY